MPEPWIDALRRDLEQEYGHKPRVATLASVDAAGAPAARSVVVRRVTDAGELWVASDGRSEKNGQLRRRPVAELVFWLPGLRRQCRLACGARVIDESSSSPDRAELWHSMSDAARSLFLWPPPGRRRQEGDDFPESTPADVPMPAAFELLAFTPTSAETLDLTTHPHGRTRWTRSLAGWRGEAVNP